MELAGGEEEVEEMKDFKMDRTPPAGLLGLGAGEAGALDCAGSACG